MSESDYILLLIVVICGLVFFAVNTLVSAAILWSISKAIRFKKQDRSTHLRVSAFSTVPLFFVLVAGLALIMFYVPYQDDPEQGLSALVTLFAFSALIFAAFSLYFMRKIYLEGWGKTIKAYMAYIFMMVVSWILLILVAGVMAWIILSFLFSIILIIPGMIYG